MEWLAEVDRFEARHGQSVITIVVRQKLTEVEQSSQGLIHGSPSYATLDGKALERIDGRHFRIVDTGDVLERV
jgi:hypothetical protein